MSTTAPTTLTNAAGLTVYRGRWGWHPVSRDQCLALKQVHKLFLKHWRRARAHRSWSRKQIQNRRGYEPELGTGLAEYMAEAGYDYAEFKCQYQALLAQYSRARRPVDGPDEVAAVDMAGWLAWLAVFDES